jgi:hypothetical protein
VIELYAIGVCVVNENIGFMLLSPAQNKPDLIVQDGLDEKLIVGLFWGIE